ncbi:hypothetical protein GCM10027167_19670 [Nocardia heshunensis]
MTTDDSAVPVTDDSTVPVTDNSVVPGEHAPIAAEHPDETDRAALSVVLVGPPGAGKSTIGRKLARELGVEMYDTDAGIEERAGRTIPEIFAQDGEPEFRRMEEEVVREAVLAGHGVVSLGGGSVLSAATRALLRDRTVIYLEISVGEGLRRTGASTNRPLLNGDDPAKKYRELMKLRRPLYREVASVRVRTDGRSPGRVVRMILAKLGLEPTPRPDDSPTDTATVEPGISSRSRARRKRRRGSRARGEQAPTTATTEATAAEPDSATRNGQTPADESEAPKRRRNRRPRRRGGRSPESGSPATVTEANGPQTAAASESGDGPASSESTAGSAGRGRRRRASRAAGAPLNPEATNQDPKPAQQNPRDADSTGPAGPVAAPGNGRSRRARARRARARAREHETSSNGTAPTTAPSATEGDS